MKKNVLTIKILKNKIKTVAGFKKKFIYFPATLT